MTPALLSVMLYVLVQLTEQHLTTFLYIVFAGALISAIHSTVVSALLSTSVLFERSTEPDRQVAS